MSKEWVTHLPSTWQSTQLRHVARIFAGGTPDRKNPAYWNGGTVPWLNSGSVNQDVITAPSELVTPLAASIGVTRWVQPQSVVVALAGQGKTKGMCARTEIGATLNQSLAAIEPGHQLDYKFLHYWLKSNYRNIRGLAGGDLRDGLNLDHIGSIHVPLPPYPTQICIADYLDHETAEIDAFIADQRALLALFNERDSARKESLLVPPNARFTEVRRLRPRRVTGVSVNAASRPAESREVGVLKTGAASKGRFIADENKAVIDSAEIERLTESVEGDRVLINRANTPELVGSAVYVAAPHPNLFLSDKLWSIDFAEATNHYIAWALTTRHYRDQVRQLSVGASASMQNLSYEDFLNIRLYVPPLEDEERIANELATAAAILHASIDDAESAIAIAQERRAALISAAVTGQIDITERRRPAVEQLQDEIEEAK